MRSKLRAEWSFAASPALLQHGCVNLISLCEIKTVAGDRWEKMRESIYAKLERILRQILGPTDFFVQIDAETFLVSSPTATKDEAQVYCLRAAQELHVGLLGHCELDQIRIARADKLDGDILECTPTGGSDLAAIALIASLRSRIGDTIDRKRLPAGILQSAPDKAAQAPHLFYSVWNAHSEAITMYRCLTAADTHAAVSEDRLSRLKDDLGRLLSRIRCATDTLSHHLAAGEKFLISVPISYELLGSPVTRMEVAALCRSLSSTLRPYLLFEIIELPHGVPQSRLSELVGSLRPFCRGVMAHLPARIPSYGAYMGAGLDAIGLSLSPLNVGTTDTECELFKLCAAAKRLRIRTFAMDVSTLAGVVSAKEQGVTMISGPPLGIALQEPLPIRRLCLDEIIAFNELGEGARTRNVG